MQAVTANVPQLEFESTLLDGHIGLIREDRPYVRFSLKPLNKLLGGVFPGLMTAIGAEPGAGKTSLAVQASDEVASQGHPVLFITEELPAYKLVCKSISRLSRGSLALENIPNALSGEGNRDAFEQALSLYRSAIAPNICFATVTSAADIARLVGDCIHERGEAPFVCVDYLQLLATRAATPFTEERLAIADCVAQLRAICNSFGTAMLVVSSIARTSYGKKPALGMFGGASAIEYSFDNALYLARSTDLSPAPDTQPLTLTAVKARYHSLESVELNFDGAHATFSARG